MSHNVKTCRILVMSPVSIYSDECCNAWPQFQHVFSELVPLEVFYFPLSVRYIDILTQLDLLDNIRAGFFDLVFVILSDGVLQSQKCQTEQLEFLAWCCEQALSCSTTRLVLTGTDSETSAAPIWSWREFQCLEGLHGAVCGSMFLCQLSPQLHDRPLSVLSNIPLLVSQLSDSSPLSVCNCVGKEQVDTFKSQCFGTQFWSVCAQGFFEHCRPSTLREWAVPGPFPPTPSGRAPEPSSHVSAQHSVEPSTPSGRALVVGANSWSAPPPRESRIPVSTNALSNQAGSSHQVYVSWLAGSLTRDRFTSFTDGWLVDNFFSIPVDGRFLASSRSRLTDFVSCASWPVPQLGMCSSGSARAVRPSESLTPAVVAPAVLLPACSSPAAPCLAQTSPADCSNVDFDSHLCSGTQKLVSHGAPVSVSEHPQWNPSSQFVRSSRVSSQQGDLTKASDPRSRALRSRSPRRDQIPRPCRLPRADSERVPLESNQTLSAAGTVFSETPLVVPTRESLEEIRRFLKGDMYVGRGCKQLGLRRSRFCNTHKVSVHGRDAAIALFAESLRNDSSLCADIWSLSGLRLVCHCKLSQKCHADVLVDEFRSQFPQAFDRSVSGGRPPPAQTLNFLAKLREEPDSSEGSSADEGAPVRGSGWRGQGRPMEVGSGYTARELCDGQTLASPGRWEPSLRRYPTHSAWESVASHFREYTHRAGTPELLLRLAVGKVAVSPFPEEEVKQLRTQVVDELISQGYGPRRTATDRDNVPIDFRLLQSLLDAAGDPEVSVGEFASGVRVGPGARLPRLPALYRRKRNWRLPEQASPEDYLEDCEDGASAWRQNYKSLEPLENEVLAVLEDQFSRGQVLKFTEQEAKAKYPKLVVASLGAQKKDKPGGVVTARVLFDGTNGVQVNKRTRIRDQERAPIAADIKRLMRQKAAVGERTFALTADVAEAHRQVPVDPRDWYLLGSQVVPGGDVYINTVGTFGVASASYYWSRVASSVGRLTQYFTGSRATTWHLLVADDYHLEAGGAEYRSALLVFFVLCAVVGVPLSWSKTAGGDVVSWVGFELLHRSHQLGISEKRAAWFVKWTMEVASQEFVNISRFEGRTGARHVRRGRARIRTSFSRPLVSFHDNTSKGVDAKAPSVCCFLPSVFVATGFSFQAQPMCGSASTGNHRTASRCTGVSHSDRNRGVAPACQP